MAAHRFFFAGVLLLVGVLYFPVHKFQYVWDDFALFLDSAALRGGSSLWTAVSQPILPGTTYFRPLVLLSFVAQFEFFGLDPKYSHLVNLLIHLVNVCLVGVLAEMLEKDSARKSAWRSFFAMAIYGLHPALIEPLAWVSGRFDLLVTTFVLLGLYGGLRGGRLGASLAIFSFFLAALCKEMAATFPALLVLMLWAVEAPVERSWSALFRFSVRRMLVIFIGVLLAGVLYLFLRHQAVSSFYHKDLAVAGVMDFYSHAALVGRTVAFYAKMVIWPFDSLDPLHPFDIQEATNGDVLAGGLIVISWGLLCVVALCVRGRFLLLALAGWVALLPVLNLIPLTIGGNLGHERFLALPLVFFSLAVSQLNISSLSLSQAMRRFAPVLLGSVFFCWLGFAFVNIRITLPVWSNELTLWGWAYEKNPESAYAGFNLISSAVKLQRLDIAGRVLGELEAAENLGGREAKLKLSAIKGYYLQRTGHHAEALSNLKESLEGAYQPHLAVLSRGIAISAASIDRKSFGEAWFLRFVYGAMAEASLALRQFSDAYKYAEIAQFYQKDYAPLYTLAAFAKYGLGDVVAGDELFATASKLYPLDGMASAEVLRKDFLRQLCGAPDAPAAVCSSKKT